MHKAIYLYHKPPEGRKIRDDGTLGLKLRGPFIRDVVALSTADSIEKIQVSTKVNYIYG